jgi:hypothetical protein
VSCVISQLSRPEVLIGRAAAISIHPYAAWQTRSNPKRLLLVGVYALASYVLVLSLMLTL